MTSGHTEGSTSPTLPQLTLSTPHSEGVVVEGVVVLPYPN